MSAAEDRQKEIQQSEIDERLAGAEEMMKGEKVKLPDDVLANAVEGLRKISEKLEKRLPVYESDFDFVEELEDVVRLGSQYKEVMANLKECGLYNPEDVENEGIPPTQEEVIREVRANLTESQKEAIAQMKEPTLLVMPIKKMTNYWTALNKNMPMVVNGRYQATVHVSPTTEEIFQQTDASEKVRTMDKMKKGKTKSWRIVITEGAAEPKLLKGDGNNETFENRLDWFTENYVKKGINGMDYKSWMLLQILKFSKNPPQPIDKDSPTLLNGTLFDKGSVEMVFWSDQKCQIIMGNRMVDGKNAAAHFRPTVVIEPPSNINKLLNYVRNKRDARTKRNTTR